MLALKELGLSDTVEVVDELMEQYDADGGGVIELAEFREFLQAVQLMPRRTSPLKMKRVPRG